MIIISFKKNITDLKSLNYSVTTPDRIIAAQQLLHSKKCWVVSTQMWVKYGQAQIMG